MDRYCHEVSLTLRHIDGEPRTYSAATRNWKDGYRLAEDMAMPRDGGEVNPEAFGLCTACHRYTDVTGDYTTGFREDEEEPYPPRNMHKKHLEEFRFYIVSDSDFSADPDGDDCSSGLCLDSAPTCTNCHNIHGSKRPSMIRGGELISTPGTENKTPALDFRWLKEDLTLTTVRERSAYGRMKVSPTRPNASINYVCTGCHGGVYPPTYQTSYFREMGVQIRDIWTTDLSNNYKTVFSPNDPIRYHLSFKLGGLMVSYQVAVGQSGAGNTPSMPGDDWVTPLSATGPRIPGTYEIAWDETIPGPGVITAAQSAAFRIRMGLFDSPGGTLLNTDEMTKFFSIVP
jgi:hypothetical protein